ncbi:hypothetical protein MRX96_026989 [Rhipicephalus microplus]
MLSFSSKCILFHRDVAQTSGSGCAVALQSYPASLPRSGSSTRLIRQSLIDAESGKSTRSASTKPLGESDSQIVGINELVRGALHFFLVLTVCSSTRTEFVALRFADAIFSPSAMVEPRARNSGADLYPVLSLCN